jgi:hypothetical protein
MVAGAALSLSVILATPTIARAQQCQPGIDAGWELWRSNYDLMWAVLTPNISNLTTLLNAMADQSSYGTLVAAARAVVANIDPARFGRLVVTLPDGTVVLDTIRPDGDTPANANSFAHFQAKSINENLNTRVAIAAAQTYPCGIGIETRLSTTTGLFESHFSVRLGSHLSSRGTARLSMVASPSVSPSPSPTPSPSASGWVWVMAVGASGVCVQDATFEVVGGGQAVGRIAKQIEPCSVWDYDGGVLLTDLIPGVGMILRASAPGFAPVEKTVTPSTGGQTAIIFGMATP